MNLMISMNHLLNFQLLRYLALVALVAALTSCSFIQGITGQVDTPLKRWAVAQDSLTGVTNSAAALMEKKKMPLGVAVNFVHSQGVAQAMLDDIFNAIMANQIDGEKPDFNVSDALDVAVKQIDNLIEIVERYTDESS